MLFIGIQMEDQVRMSANKNCELFYQLAWSASKLSRHRSGTVSWVLRDPSDERPPLSPLIKLCIRPKRKERKKESSTNKQTNPLS